MPNLCLLVIDSASLDAQAGLRHLLGMTNQIKGSAGAATSINPPLPVKVAYCLYARKSTESEEQQVLSIDSQIKEMIKIAERDGLEIAEIRKESHSAKAVGHPKGGDRG